MSNKVLVAYASKYGATAEIAEKIGQVLSQAGLAAEVLPVNRVSDLSAYAAVVLGSAVYMGNWRKEAVKFLTDHENELAKRPVWLFSSGPAGEGDPVELMDGWRFPKAQQAIADRIQPRDIAVFHGSVDVTKLNFIEKWMLTNVHSPIGDYRDWQSITAWADEIAAVLKEKDTGVRNAVRSVKIREFSVEMNHATRTIVATLGTIFGISGISHGFYETLQGNVPTGGLLISAIGPAHKLWPHGNEMAFTLIPNFRITGIAAMLVGLALIIWSLAFVHRKNGATVLLLLFIVLLLVGGGVAQVLFFPWIWLVATRIHHPLNGWRKILPLWLQKPLGKMWIGCLLAGSALLVFVLIISITGFVPGVKDPDTVLSIMLTCLADWKR